MNTAKELSQRERRVAHWAHESMQLKNFCVLDTETTSFHGEIIDIAILGPDGTVLLDQLIKPQGRIEEAAAAVHGLTTESVADAPTFLEVWPHIFEVLQGFQRIITYNADFDSKRLMHTGLVNGINIHCCIGLKVFPPAGTHFAVKGYWSCLMTQYAQFWGEPSRYGDNCKWQKLHVACRQQGIEHDNWHRALGDCQASLKLLRALGALYTVAPPDAEAKL